MKIVATSDTHYPFDNSLIPDGDVFILAGDMMYKGTPDEWDSRVESLAALPHKTKIYVPGNHDYFPLMYRGLARSQLRRQAGVMLVDDRDPMIVIGGVKILCIPFVTGLEGWAYNRTEHDVFNWLEAIVEEEGVPQVIVSHAPPYQIRDAVGITPVQHYGCMAYNRWFYNPGEKPKVWICGHIHDSYGHERIDNCDFYNVAMCNEDYKQVNPAMEIYV